MRLVFCYWIVLWFLLSCTSPQKLPNTDIEVATTFINAIQLGKQQEAEALLLKDETNSKFFKDLKPTTKEEKERYKNSNIVIYETTNVSDSITIFNYANSLNKNEKNKIKVIRRAGQWLVDLKYSFSGNL